MGTTIDAGGRIVVPKHIRELAGFVPGMRLDVRFRDGRVEIEPAPTEVAIVDEGGVLVGHATAAVPVMPAHAVDFLVSAQRSERE